MPEGPEVRIIVDQLNDRVVGKVFSAFEVVGGRYAHTPDISFDKISAHLPMKVNSVKCKGKFIYWEFEKEWYLWNTLGMTGGWSINTHTAHKTVRLRLDQDDYYFNDVRHFGTVKFVKSKNLLQHRLATLGPDVLAGPPSQQSFYQSIVASSKTLAEYLMNQKNVSGVGNYIKAEALYRAKLSPWRKGNTLTRQDSDNLLKAITDVAQESYKLQGTTLANYKDLLGEEGGFSEKLQVYGKKKDPYGNVVTSEDTPDKRTSWWVPGIQK